MISEETDRAQALLSDRNEIIPVANSSPALLPNTNPNFELDDANFKIMTQVIERDEWSQLELQCLAKCHGLMPFAVIEKLNTWAIENFDALLLEGGSRVVVNTNLTKEIKAKYEQNP